ncbi:hypothetical protein [Rhizobacter fulvus]|jgi:hypothetical protein
MSFALDPRQHRRAARLIVWCLACALASCGFWSVRVQVLGTNHTHVRAAAVDEAMAGWQDFRRAAHLAGVSSTPAHGHALYQRHHHGAADTSLASLDAPGSAATSGDAPNAQGATLLGLPPIVAPFADPARSADAARWRDIATGGIDRLEAGRLERPPRA